MDIADCCDWIALPVDAVTQETLRMIRGDVWDLYKAIDLANRLKHTNEALRVKLGTVATRMNLKEILTLASTISALPEIPFDTWKIYQYTPRRKFAGQREIYEITNNAFGIFSKEIRKTHVCERINTVFSSHTQRRRAYLFVYPDGTLAIPNEGKDFSDIVIGNFATEGEAVLDKVDNYTLFSNGGNYEVTYG